MGIWEVNVNPWLKPLTALAVLAFCVSSADAQQRQFRFGAPFTTGSNLHKAMLRFAEVVETETKGAIKIQVYPDSQIGDISQLISGMQLGTVDMAYLGIGNAAGLKGGGPLNVAYTPYLFDSKEKATEAFNGPIFTELFENLATESGVRVFAVAGARSPRAVQTVKGPVNKPEDLKGMRLRIPPIDMFRAAFEQVGVKSVAMGLSEVYNAISRGQVDGQDNGFDLSLAFKWHEVAKYWSATDHVYEIATWYIGDKQWQSLTPEQRDVFKRAAQEGGKVATQLGEEIDRQGVEDLKKAGAQFVKPDLAAFKEAWKDVHKPYEGKVWPTGLVEKIRAAQKN